MSTAVASIGISLEVGCGLEECAAFAGPLLLQLGSGRYDRCSVLEIPDDLDEWRADHRTARKRADRAARRGYTFGPFEPHRHVSDIYEINTSLDSRQGRRMGTAYRRQPSMSPFPVYLCPRHEVTPYGVFTGKRLVAYLYMYRAGELLLVSQILGHGDYLRDEIMYLLFQGALEFEIPSGPGVVVYNRHDSGTDGLRFFKERLGFTEQTVEWLP